MRDVNEHENKELSDLFAQLDEINKESGTIMVAAVETCCDTGLLVKT